jgi:hypothetical protein
VKGLTDEEGAYLRTCTHCCDCKEPDDDEVALQDRLVARGLLKWCSCDDPDWIHCLITPLGRLALACHQAARSWSPADEPSFIVIVDDPMKA